MKKVFLTVLLMAGFTCTSFGQFRMALGPILGTNYNFYHGMAVDNANRSYGGVGLSVGGQADMRFTPVVGMLVTIAYDNLSAKGSVTQQATKDVIDIGLAYLAINPALKFSVPGTGLGFFGGPGIGFKFAGNTQHYQFANGQRTQVTQKADLLNTNLRVNGQIGMSYDFDMKGMSLAPYFLFDYGFTEVTEGGEFNASGIKFGLAIKFNVTK